MLLNKRTELLQVIALENPDVVCLTEILPKHCKIPVMMAEIQLEEYDCFTNINEDGAPRGVAIYVKNSLAAVPSSMTTDFKESVWCEIPLKSKDRLVIGCIYRSPNSTQDNNDKLNKVLRDLYRSHVLIVGDFNYPELDWKDHTSPLDEGHRASLFMEAVRDAFLIQHVTDPTHYRAEQKPNVLDLIFTNEDNMVSSLEHLSPLGKSHHQVLKFVYTCYTEEQEDNRGKRFAFLKGDYDRLRELIRNHSWEDELKDLDVKEAWCYVEMQLLKAMEETVPKKKWNKNHKKRKPLWMNEEALRKIRKKRQAYQRYLDTKEGKDYLGYTKARNQVKWMCKKAVRDFERQIAREAKKNPKAFFAYARSKLKTKEGIADLDQDDGGTASTNEAKANVLNAFFSSVFTKESLDNPPPFEDRHFNEALADMDISPETVAKKLKGLKINKSPGPDGHHPYVLRELAIELSVPLSIVFRKSLDEGCLPQAWKDAHVTPLFKKGKKSSPGNYRPVSLTSIICKLMESLVRDRVVQHMVDNNLHTDYQHGFINGRSCATNLLAVLDAWSEAIDIGVPVDAIYLDFAKAFDTVPHHRLITKLMGYGVQDKIVQWIQAFLQDRRQCVSINGIKSEWAPVTSGIPQGSVLGPCLFVIFINDLPDVTHSMAQMFADDTKVFRQIHEQADQQVLQDDIDNLSHWSDTWQLRFNAKKCKVLHIGRNNPQHQYSMYVKGEKEFLEVTELEKDLGVNVDPELKFSRHIEVQVNKANKILGMIRRSYEFIDADTMKRLFTALVRPHLEYSNVAWSPRLVKDKKLIEGVQRRATKLVPELKELPYEERLEKMKLPSLCFRRARGDMIEAYKYTHDFYTVNEGLLQRDDNTSTRGHNFKLKKRYCRTATRHNFFSFRVVDSWNQLPSSVVNAPSLNSFKSRLDKVWSHHAYTTNLQFPLPPQKVVEILSDDSDDQLTGSYA